MEIRVLKDSLSSLSVCIGLAFTLAALTLVAAGQGAVKIGPGALLDDAYRDIWLNIRLPRVLLAILVGGALSAAGVLMQGLFRNPMADPGLLGVSSGSALLVGVAIVFPVALPAVFLLYEQMIFAVGGSVVVCALIFLISLRHTHGGMMQLLLAGIAINALCGAAIGVLSYVGDEQQLRQLTLWMMGSLGQAQWSTLLAAASVTLPALAATLWLANTLNLLQLGDEEAHYLGVNVRRKRQQLLLLSSVLVGAAVSVSGVIGFVGLVVPHLIRMIAGADHRWLLPSATLAGACLLLIADTLARTLVQPAEMPVGLLTSLIGGPWFLWLILRSRRAM
jgi:iron complex transport system permease protein